ncbi:hypothetical protein ACP70R_045333 [Stipagrostis hirtigluma subsp. patula]
MPPVHEHVEQVRRRQHSLSELTYARDEDAKLESTRARLSNILKRHEDLKERLSWDSDKLNFERLQKEFEAARAAQTEGAPKASFQRLVQKLKELRTQGGPEVEGGAGGFDLNVPAEIFADGGGGPAAAGHEADSVVDLVAEIFPFDLNMEPETFPTEDEQENLQSGAQPTQQGTRSYEFLTNDQRDAVYKALLATSTNGKLQNDSTKIVSTTLGVKLRTVQRIWREAKQQEAQGLNVDVSHKKAKRVGRKKVDIDFSQVPQIALRKRTTLKSLAAELHVSVSTVHRRLKMGMLRRHSNALKPLSKDGNRKSRLEFCWSMLDQSTLSTDPKFIDMQNIIHIDGNWFFMTKKNKKYYLLPEEEDPHRTIQNKNAIEMSIDDEHWNDGLLATIREKVHMEADRKAMTNQVNIPADPQFQSRTTYRIGNKVIYCLDGARIGIQYETFFAGEPCEIFHCVLESKSFLEKMTVIEHTLPFFLPIRELESDLLSSNAIKFIDHLEEILQAYIDRREQVRLIKELYGNQIGQLYNSLPYNVIEFVLEDFDCGHSQYPVFGSSDDPAESGKGLGLATSLFQENISNRS